MLTLRYMPNTSSVLHLHPTLVPLLFVQSILFTCNMWCHEYRGIFYLCTHAESEADRMGEIAFHSGNELWISDWNASTPTTEP